MKEGWLKNKSIVVIGGTTGLGLSATKAFVEQGANVVAIGRNPESIEKAASALRNAHVFAGDATKPGVAEKAITECLEHYGGFDGLYHVAGGSGRRFGDGPLHSLTDEGWDYTLSLNLKSLMMSNRAAVKTFLERKQGGSILNMGSVLGYSPSPRHFATHAYAAAKAAAIGFTKSIAAYYASSDIRINLIAPALVETPMAQRAANDETILSFVRTKQPLDGGRIGTPSDLDGAAIYFMSDYSKFTTGQILSVDGGWDLSEGQYDS
jgi:NAD(P)-dependent dehydrogenase (short-subunit alcohol dehydrogenase family)